MFVIIFIGQKKERAVSNEPDVETYKRALKIIWGLPEITFWQALGIHAMMFLLFYGYLRYLPKKKD